MKKIQVARPGNVRLIDREIPKIETACQVLVSLAQAALIEPYTIGAEANWRGGGTEGDVVLIYGAGAIGLAVLDTAKSLGDHEDKGPKPARLY